MTDRPSAPPPIWQQSAPNTPEQARPAGGTRILCVANQKGGVGKTTTAINLGTALAAIGAPVLLLDLDPQGNASTGLGVEQEARRTDTFELLLGEIGVAEAIHQTAVPGLDLIPASMDLLGIEVALADNPRRLLRLADALKAFICGKNSDMADDKTKPNVQHCPYHYVLIDCPPSLNMLTLNAMGAAQSVLVPLQCEFFALEGLSQLLHTIEQVKSDLNPQLDIQGIVLTMYDARNNLSAQVEADVRTHFAALVYDTLIPRNVRVSEAPSFGKPALLYDYQCAGSLAYMRLASELITRERARTGAAA